MAKSTENSKPNLPSSSYTHSSTKVHPSNDLEMDPSSYSLEKFRLYETRARFYLIRSDRNKKWFHILKTDRSELSDLNLSEDLVVYSSQEIKNLLQQIAEGNRSTGGLAFVAKVYGIAGCIKFLESYYLILVTKRRQIGCICGHAVYGIDETQLITIPHVSVQSDVAHSKTELQKMQTATSFWPLPNRPQSKHGSQNQKPEIVLNRERKTAATSDLKQKANPWQRKRGRYDEDEA